MAIDDLVSKIILEDEFTGTFRDFNRQADQADDKTKSLGRSFRDLATATGVAVGVVGGAAVAVREFTDRSIEAQKAQFNLAASATAAANEFGAGVGSVESWEETVGDLRGELRLFSNQELNNATSRLIDMTKRLGLSEEQMQETLRRTADLAAGKTDLVGGIERVTAGLRGEAEAAEFLGLSLNETTIRNYAEAQGLVWQSLTDTEKAQLRYAVLLEQTNELQGRAAEFAGTLAGREEALNAALADQTALIGQQLLPLREGYVQAISLMATSTTDGVGVISQALAAFAAALVSASAVGVIFQDALGQLAGGLRDAAEAAAEGRNPLQAFADAPRESIEGLGEALSDLPGLARDAYNQIIDGWSEQEQAIDNVALATDRAGQGQNDFADNATAAARAVAEAYEQMASDREQAAAKMAQRVEALEMSHAQRVARIQEQMAAQIADAQAEAAARRGEAAADLAASISDIERDLASDLVNIQAEYNADLAGLRQEREDAERDYASRIEDIERDLADTRTDIQAEYSRAIAELEQETTDTRTDIQRNLARNLAELEQDTADTRTDLSSDLSDDLTDLERQTANSRADILRRAEADRLDITRDYRRDLLSLEQRFADQRRRIDQDYSDEFADADPFQRKILEFNRQEALRQLDEQQAAERDALANQRDQALTVIEQRTAEEQAILEQSAAQKAAILEREASQRLAILERETEQSRAKLEQQAADKLAILERETAQERAVLAKQWALHQQEAEQEAERRQQEAEAQLEQQRQQLSRREDELAASLQREQAQRQQAAATAIANQQEQYRQELASIDEQEAERTRRAQEQLRREQQNYQDRLAQLQLANQQELANINSKFTAIEQAEEAHQQERIDHTRAFAAEMQRLNGLAASYDSDGGSPGAAAGFGPNPGTINRFASGGIVPGPEGQPRRAIVHGGERIIPPGQQAAGSNTTIERLIVQVSAGGGDMAGMGQAIGRSLIDVLEGRA